MINLSSSTRAPATKGRHRGAALAVLCAAVFVINVDTTIVNIALPALVRELGPMLTAIVVAGRAGSREAWATDTAAKVP